MKKKLIALILCSCIMCSLTACFHQHTWAEADCIHPRTCTGCGATEGAPLGHAAGDWELAETDIVNAQRTEQRLCSRCGEVLETRSAAMDSMVQGDVFLFTPAQFMDRFIPILNEMIEISPLADSPLTITSDEDSKEVLYHIYDGELYIGQIYFGSADDQIITRENIDCNVCIVTLRVSCDLGEIFGLYSQLLSACALRACKPAIEGNDSLAICAEGLRYACDEEYDCQVTMAAGDIHFIAFLNDARDVYGFMIYPEP